MSRGASTLVSSRGPWRCKGVPGAFQPSPLVPSMRVCRYCGAQQHTPPAPPPVPSVQAVSPQPTLYTLGYAGARLEHVVHALTARKVQVVLDARWNAYSQHQGFDGETLRRAIEGHGMAYRHRPERGAPPNLRRALVEDGDWDAFAAAYRTHIAKQEACRALWQHCLEDILKRNGPALAAEIAHTLNNACGPLGSGPQGTVGGLVGSAPTRP